MMALSSDWFHRCNTTIAVHNKLRKLLICEYLKMDDARERFRLNCRSDLPHSMRQEQSIEKILDFLEDNEKFNEGNYGFIKEKVDDVDVAITDLIQHAESRIKEIRENALLVSTCVTGVEPAYLERETREKVDAILLAVSEFIICRQFEQNTNVSGLWNRFGDLQTMSNEFLHIWHGHFCKCRKYFGHKMLLQFIAAGAIHLSRGETEYDHFKNNIFPYLEITLRQSASNIYHVFHDCRASLVSTVSSSVLSYWKFDSVHDLDLFWGRYCKIHFNAGLQKCFNSIEVLSLLKADSVSMKMIIHKSDYLKYRESLVMKPPITMKERLYEINLHLSQRPQILSYLLRSPEESSMEPVYAPVSLMEETDRPGYYSKLPDRPYDIFCTSDEPCWKKTKRRHKDTNSTFVFLIGEAGCGKTTYCLHILHQWCEAQKMKTEKTSQLGKFDYVFYVDLSLFSSYNDSVCKLISYGVFKNEKKYQLEVRRVLENPFYKCLVLIEGIQDLKSSRYLEKEVDLLEDLFRNCVFAFTMRPSDKKDFPYSLCEKHIRVIRLLGLDRCGIRSYYNEKLFKSYQTQISHNLEEPPFSKRIKESNLEHGVKKSDFMQHPKYGHKESEHEHKTEVSNPEHRKRESDPKHKAKESNSEQRRKQSNPEHKLKVSNPEQKIRESNSEQRIKVTNPEQKIKSSNPEQKRKQLNPEQKIKDSNPEQNIILSNPEERGKLSIPEQRKKLSYPEQKIKVSNPEQKIKVSDPKHRTKISDPGQGIMLPELEQALQKLDREYQREETDPRLKVSNPKQKIKVSYSAQRRKVSYHEQRRKVSNSTQTTKESNPERKIKVLNPEHRLKESDPGQKIKELISEQSIKVSNPEQKIKVLNPEHRLEESNPEQKIKELISEQSVKVSNPEQRRKVTNPEQNIKVLNAQQKMRVLNPEQKIKVSYSEQEMKILKLEQSGKLSDPEQRRKLLYPEQKRKELNPAQKIKVPNPAQKIKVSNAKQRGKLSYPEHERKFSNPEQKIKVLHPKQTVKKSDPEQVKKLSDSEQRIKLSYPELRIMVPYPKQRTKITYPEQRIMVSDLEQQMKEFNHEYETEETDPRRRIKFSDPKYEKDESDYLRMLKHLLNEDYESIMQVPMLGAVCVGLLMEGKEVPRNRASLNLYLIDKLIKGYKSSTSYENVSVKGEQRKDVYDIFRTYENIHEHLHTLFKLGKVAYDDLLSPESLLPDSQKLYESSTLEGQIGGDEVVFSINNCPIVRFDITTETGLVKRRVHFLHRVIQESLTAMYLIAEKKDIVETFCTRLTSVEVITDLSNVIMTVSGLSPYLGSVISTHIKNVVDKDRVVSRYRKHPYLYSNSFFKEFYKQQLSWYIEYKNAMALIGCDETEVFHVSDICIDYVSDKETINRTITLLSDENVSVASLYIEDVPNEGGLSDKVVNDFLANNKSLVSLYIEDTGSRYIDSISMTNLEYIKLSDVQVQNTNKKDKAALTLLSKLPKVQEVDLCRVKLNDRLLGLTSEGVKMPFLRKLNISFLYMGGQTVELTSDMVDIEHINFTEVKMSSHSWKAFVRSLIGIQHSFFVELYRTDIDPESNKMILFNPKFEVKRYNANMLKFKRV